MLSYNEFWYERGIELTRDHRTSLIVDPPDGRLPWKEEARRTLASNRLNLRNGFADSYTDRSLSDRCIMGFNSGPPMTAGAYNNNVLIVQTPDHVVILNDMVHNVRIIPTDGRAHGAIRQWAGDSRGHWERDTLVVETTNFLRETAARGSSKDSYLTERFRRIDADTVIYQFTVEDTTSFMRPWTAMLPLRRTNGPLFEYACHEGNIGMHGILAGARNLDTQSVDGTPYTAPPAAGRSAGGPSLNELHRLLGLPSHPRTRVAGHRPQPDPVHERRYDLLTVDRRDPRRGRDAGPFVAHQPETPP